LLGATALQGGLAHATTVSQDLVFGNSGQSIWQSGTGGSLSYDGLLGPSWNNVGGSVGRVKCGFFGCYGAELSLNTSGSAGLAYSFQASSGALTLTFPEKVSFTTPDAGTVAAGAPFTIQATVTPGATITLASGAVSAPSLQTTGPTLAASLSLQAQATLSASARGCIAGCIRGGFNVNPSFSQPLLSLDTAQNTLSVLGNAVTPTNGAFAYTVPGGLATITAKSPVLKAGKIVFSMISFVAASVSVPSRP